MKSFRRVPSKSYNKTDYYVEKSTGLNPNRFMPVSNFNQIASASCSEFLANNSITRNASDFIFYEILGCAWTNNKDEK